MSPPPARPGPPGHSIPKSTWLVLPGTALLLACSVPASVSGMSAAGAVCDLPALFASLCTSNTSKFMVFVVFQYNYIRADPWVRHDSARDSLSRGWSQSRAAGLAAQALGRLALGFVPQLQNRSSLPAERIWRYVVLGVRDGIEFCPESLQPLEGER